MTSNRSSRAARAARRLRTGCPRGATWLVVGALQLGGLGCGSPEHAPPVTGVPFGTGGAGPVIRGSGGRSARDSGSAGKGSGGALGRRDAGISDGGIGDDSDSAPVDAGCSIRAYETPPGAVTGVCQADSAWGTAQPIATVSTPDDDLFGSVSATERTLAWMSVVNGIPTLHYADRASADVAFNPPGSISIAAGYYAADRPALSPDGNRLVVVRVDGKGIGEYTRTALYGSFTGTASEASFAALNAQGLLFASDERFGDLQLSNDDRTLYYSRYDSRSRQTVYFVTRSPGGPWQVGSPVEGAPLMGSCGRRMRPTGVSSDQLSLFYWDEVTGTERVTFRPTVGAEFAGVIDLGSRLHAQPNVTCKRLYYSVPSDASLALEDIAVSSR
jgi:hypothetical protein